MQAIGEDGVAFIATALEGIVYGLFCALFVTHVRLWRKSAAGIHFLLPVVVMFALCGLFNFFDLTQEFVWLFRANDTETEYIIFVLNILMSVIYASVNAVSQSILIFRSWALWTRRPLILFGLSLLSSISFVTCIALSIEKIIDYENDIPRWFYHLGIVSFSTSLVVNVLATSLIATKLFFGDFAGADFARKRRRDIQHALWTVIDSGAPATTVQIVWVFLFVLQPTGFNAFGGLQVMAYAISATLLLSRLIADNLAYNALEDEEMTFAPPPIERRYAASPDWSVVGEGKRYAVHNGDDDEDTDEEEGEGDRETGGLMLSSDM